MSGIDLLHTRDGRLDEQSEPVLAGLLARLRRAADPKLILFVHGGLVRQAQAESTADFLDSPLGYGGLKDEGWETAYLIWRSSVAETFEINREELAGDPLFVRAVLRVAAWIERRVGLARIDAALFAGEDLEPVMAALDSLPEKDAAAVRADLAGRGDELIKARNVEGLTDEHLLDTDLARELLDDPVFATAARVGADEDRLDRNVRVRIAAARRLPPATARTGAEVDGAAYVVTSQAVLAGLRVLKRYLAGRDHGIGPTVVEEVGRALYLDVCGARAWSLMKQDAPDHFRPGRAGVRLLAGLSEVGAAGRTVRLIVIGHSAGSLFASHFAEAVAAARSSIMLDLIFLAPAIRMSKAAELLGDAPAAMNGFRMFTMGDTLETANRLDGTRFGGIYRRSLLYLIAGMLERKGRGSYPDAPLLGLERHVAPLVRLTAAERKVHAAVTTILQQSSGRAAFSETAPDAPAGRRTAASSHGGYWEDVPTLESIVEIARRGYGA